MGNIIITISMAAVAVVLVLGLINMMRGGSPNRSQSLMRWRVGLQFATILVVILVLWLRGH
ncbi:MAG: twin transmembrane helix small protein [Pseudomonadota bacterium]|nr:twin transmembrane helix small protein [Pseudomonadota bacterium]